MQNKDHQYKKISFLTPFGWTVIEAENDFMTRLYVSELKFQNESIFLKEAVKELSLYFEGKLTKFSIPLSPKGTELQKQIWSKMKNIPYGMSLSYKEFGEKYNLHPRTVGMACSHNPIPLLIPCHRIVHHQSKISQYSFGEGPRTKKYLLDLEKSNLQADFKEHYF